MIAVAASKTSGVRAWPRYRGGSPPIGLVNQDIAMADWIYRAALEKGIGNGPNGATRTVRTLWIAEHLSGITKFVTLIPDKRRTR